MKIAQYKDWGRDCYCDPGKDNTCGRRFGWKLEICQGDMIISIHIHI